MNDDLRLLVADWHRRCRQSQRANYEAAALFSRRHVVLGVLTIVVTLTVASALFSSPGGSSDAAIRLFAGVLSVVAAVLATLQTFFRYNERADRHRLDSAQYGALRRKLEQLMALSPSDEMAIAAIEVIRQSMDELAQRSQEVPARAKAAAVRDLEAKPRQHPAFAPFDDSPPT